jgi:hypothetical protein
MTKQLKSAIIYRGPSLIDGKPIVAIATYSKRNRKTGGMLQTYILVDGIDPRVANKAGLDYSICGGCPFKGIPHNEPDKALAKLRKCYVRIDQGPLNVYKTLARGVYPEIRGHKAIADLGRGRMVRIGTYGDGAAVPSYIWDSLISEATGYTAYSHQALMRTANFRSDLYMRSIDSLEEAYEAWANGQRTFRVINSVTDIVKGKEILCPASKEAGRRVQCANCKLCGGTRVQAKSIAIPAH